MIEFFDFYRNIYVLIILIFVEICYIINDVKINCNISRYLFLFLFLFFIGYKCIIFKKNVFFKIGNVVIIILMFKVINFIF